MRKQEKFGSALAVSIVAHLLLLWPAVSPDVRGGSAQTLAVVLRPLPSEPLAAAASAATAVSSHPDVMPVAAAAKAAPVPQTLASPSRESDSRSSTAETASRSGGQPSGGSAAAAEPARQSPATVAGGAGIDAEGVRQYRVALAVEARRFRRYPARALADELSGTVEVRVAVAAGGQAQEVALAHSSGHEALDDAALEMMRKAAPRTAVPEPLRQRAFSINLPVVFDVADN
jgi:protein TonB